MTLDLEFAKSMVRRLMAIGHPYHEDAIMGSALDLTEWCKGAFIDGVAYAPEDQADWVVTQARRWAEGWPDRGGPEKLRALFMEKFAPGQSADLPQFPPLEIKEAIRRGLVSGPCRYCLEQAAAAATDTPEICPYAGATGHKKYLPELEASSAQTAESAKPKEASKTGMTLPRIELEQLIANAERNYQEDLRRKRQREAGEQGATGAAA